MMFSRKVFWGATSPLRPPGILTYLGRLGPEHGSKRGSEQRGGGWASGWPGLQPQPGLAPSGTSSSSSWLASRPSTAMASPLSAA